MSEWIQIGDPVLKGNRVENQITMSAGMARHFKYRTFYVKYDEEIQWNPSILNIPAVASLITFAWLSNAELRVGDLDAKFTYSLMELYREYEDMYPNVLGGRLLVQSAWQNKPNGEGLALFFSGGLDSTYSLYELLDRTPRLIMVKGFDYYMDQAQDEHIWQRWKNNYAPFAEKLGLKINFVETNSRAILDEGKVAAVFGRILLLPFWDALRHSLLLIGLAAPLSIGRFDELVISASRTPQSPTTIYPYATAPNTDELIGWMGLHVVHYGRVHRYEKAAALVDHVNAGELILRCCFKQLEDKWNCSLCEKCMRVILFLLTAGADPNKCGFDVNQNTFVVVKNQFLRDINWRYRSKLHWQPWVENLPDDLPNVPGLDDLLCWLKKFKFDTPDLLEREPR